MAQLLVRDIDPTLVRKLKRRASTHGISAEEEHRRILRDALSRPAEEPPTLMEFLLNSSAAPDVELLLERSRDVGSREIEF